MSTLVSQIELPFATRVDTDDNALIVTLDHGRTVSVPLAWYPRLLHATERERANWRLIGGGEGIHWTDLDEDISVESLIAGHASRESQKSLQKWLSSRSEQLFSFSNHGQAILREGHQL